MRNQINKLKKNHSTKAERKFCELLKELHIPFRTKTRIKNKEVDFLIDNTDIIEIDSHPQDVGKNYMLLEEGYNIIHFNNFEISTPYLKDWLIKRYGRYKLIGKTSDNRKPV